ncbi:MAG: hypothetical protein DRI95_10615 [Bacteroidetes bacterium]|nr:MAG: hypothetical protein DRI95_10615 [Bacteroidota bacterium]
MKNIIISLFALIVAGCTKTTQDLNPYLDIPVVQAFLSPGVIPEVSLTRVYYFSDEDADTLNYINNALVYLINDSLSFQLQESDDTNGIYFYDGQDLVIKPDDNYSIVFDYKNTEVSSTTEIPNKPEDYKLSDDVVSLPRILEGETYGGMPSVTEIEFTWTNNTNDYFLVNIQYLEDVYDPVNANIVIEDPATAANFTSSPIQDAYYSIRTRQFQYFGSYNAIIMSIPTEYAELYESLNQSSLDGLAETKTNVINGKGIFTSFNTDTLQIEVKPQ